VPLPDFIAERRVVYFKGRRYTVRRLTVAAVVRIEEEFAVEIAAGVCSYEESPDMWACGDPLAIALALVRDPRRLLRSLLAVVDTDEDPQAWPYMELARACLEMSDCATIVQDLKVDGSPVESQDKRFVEVAERFGVAPHEVMEWPFESFLATLAALFGGGVSEEQWFVPGDPRLEGVGYRKAATPQAEA